MFPPLDFILVVLLAIALEIVMVKRLKNKSGFVASLLIMFFTYTISKVMVLIALTGALPFKNGDMSITTDASIHYAAMAIVSLFLAATLVWVWIKNKPSIGANQ